MHALILVLNLIDILSPFFTVSRQVTAGQVPVGQVPGGQVPGGQVPGRTSYPRISAM